MAVMNPFIIHLQLPCYCCCSVLTLSLSFINKNGNRLMTNIDRDCFKEPHLNVGCGGEAVAEQHQRDGKTRKD